MPFRLSQADLTDGDRADLLATMLDSTLDAVIVIDMDGVVLEWSRTATEIFGFSREATVGRLLDSLIIPPDLVEAHRTGMTRFRATGKGPVLGRRIEIEAVNQAGERFPVELAITDVPARAQIYFIARLRNITDRVRYERHLKLVAHELDHRVKNSLAVILAIAHQTARREPSTSAFMPTYEARVLSYTRTHDLLIASQYQGANLRDMFVGEFEPYQDHPIVMAGPDVSLPAAAALTIGMCIHEMTTNAVKHGSLSVEGGRIAVAWRLTEAEVVIDWTETGGPDPGTPTRKGFGSRLIKMGLIDDLQGSFRLEFPASGLTGEVRIPLGKIRAST